MTLFLVTEAGRQPPKGTKLTTTSATSILDGSAAGIITLESINISCNTSTTLSIWLTDGTTTWYIMETATLTANARVLISDLHVQLRSGWSLKAQAAAANRVDIITVFALSTQQTKGQTG